MKKLICMILTLVMVTEAVEAYVTQDLNLARKVMAHEDVVDDYFTQVRKGIIDIIAAEPSQGDIISMPCKIQKARLVK